MRVEKQSPPSPLSLHSQFSQILTETTFPPLMFAHPFEVAHTRLGKTARTRAVTRVLTIRVKVLRVPRVLFVAVFVPVVERVSISYSHTELTSVARVRPRAVMSHSRDARVRQHPRVVLEPFHVAQRLVHAVAEVQDVVALLGPTLLVVVYAVDALEVGELPVIVQRVDEEERQFHEVDRVLY